jgi:hypothetical protein
MSDKRYPLCWPDGWQRTNPNHRKPAAFRRASRKTPDAQAIGGYRWQPQRRVTMEEAVGELQDELRRLGASLPILSTNVRLRQDGIPYSAQKTPDDPGAAVYFKLKGMALALACDKWNRVEDNVVAIARHIEALRAQERWGVGRIEQAFRGYAALPGPGASTGESWWLVLGVAHNCTAADVKARFRELAKTVHPDVGGAHEAWLRLQAAYDTAAKSFPELG